MSELAFSHPRLTVDDFQVSYVNDRVCVSIPKVSVVWTGSTEEATEIVRGLLDKWGQADLHACLLKGVLKK